MLKMSLLESIGRLLAISISNIIQRFEVVKLPVSTKSISFNTLYAKLMQEFPGADIFLSDRNFKLCAYDDIAWFLAQDQTNKLEYVAEKYDCDDFAYRLMGQFSVPGWSDLAFGLVWTEKHAMNIIVAEDKKIFFIEPQSDKLEKELKLWQGTNVRCVMI